MLNPPSPVTKAAKDGMLGQSASNSIFLNVGQHLNSCKDIHTQHPQHKPYLIQKDLLDFSKLRSSQREAGFSLSHYEDFIEFIFEICMKF